MADVFLSYGREDQAVAERFAKALEREGLDVWWDAALRSGEAYDQVIENALNNAKAVVVLWSPRSVDSRWVRAEATQAERNGTLAPVMIEACKKPIMFELTQTTDLSHWTGDSQDKTWLSFVAEIRRFLDRRVDAQSTSAARPIRSLEASKERSHKGERRQITVLDGALFGAGSGAATTDPEDWREIVEAFRRQASQVVSRFEGQVTSARGDAFTAFFGAELTREDDADRAVRAAMGLVDMLKTFKPGGGGLSIRIGIDSGLVIFGDEGTPAFGAPITLAEQLQSQAAPESVVISSATATLAGGYLELEPFGARAFRVAGRRSTHTRFDLSRARGLSDFVGRDREFNFLEDALALSEAGDGQVVGLVAEAGSGKSRLCFEFLERCRARGIAVFECSAVAHGRNIPLRPILDLFRAFFGIKPDDEAATARAKIDGRLLVLDPAVADSAPLVFDFLGVSDPDRPTPMIDPDTRQRQLIGLMRHVIQRAGDERTSVTLIEDLHWLDPASEQFLEHMVHARAGARSLLVLNYRPEYQPDWTQNSWCRQVALAPLANDAVEALLKGLLGDDPSLAALAPMIEARTKCNPYFVEEVVQALIETRHLEGVRGAYRLVTPVERLEVPATVTAVVAARIDRLSDREKRLLQTASVIGLDFTEPLLAAVTDLAPKALGEALTNLRRAEFLFEKAIFPVAEFSFKHPLTQEVALGTLLKDQRRRIHASLAQAIAQQDAARLGERAALIAHHWEAAGSAVEAARWHQRAAQWVGGTDPAAAARHWGRVRALLREGMAEGDAEAAVLGIAACQHLLNLSWRLTTTSEEIDALGQEGRAFARAAGDRAAEVKIAMVYTRARASIGDLSRYVEASEENQRAAEELDDLPLKINAGLFLVDALVYAARFSEALELADQMLVRVVEKIAPTEWLAGFNPYGALKFWRAASLTLLGRLPESVQEYNECRVLAEEDGTPEAGAYLSSWSALSYLSMGDIESVMACADEVDVVCTALGDPPTIVAHRQLCRTYVHLAFGRSKEAIETASAALAIHQVGERQHAGLSAMLLAEAQLQAGDAAAAVSTATQAVEYSRQALRANLEVQGLGVLARALIDRDGEAGFGAAAQALESADGLITSLGAKTLEPSLLEWRAALAAAQDDLAGRNLLLSKAAELFEEIGAPLQAGRLRQGLAVA